MKFASRLAGASKLDHGVMLDFLAGLYERYLGRYVPTRFALFGTVGAIGVGVHFAVLALVMALGLEFSWSQATATMAAMTFNFWLNNVLTYRDRQLAGPHDLFWGWLSFCGACAVGAFANVAAATLLYDLGVHWYGAALAGVVLASVWNYTLSRRFVWGRFR